MTTTTPGDDTRTLPTDHGTPTRSTARWMRVSAVAGIIGALLHLSMGAAVGFPPAFDDPADELRQWFADNEGVIDLFTWLMPATAIAFVVFAAGIRNLLASTDVDAEADGMWSRLSFTGAVAQLAVALVGLSIWGVLAQESVRTELADGTLRALAAMDSLIFFVLMNWATALFYGAAAFVVLRSRILPTWIGGLGLAVAVAYPIGGLWLVTDGDPENVLGSAVAGAAFLGGHLFTVSAAVVMLRRANG